MGATERNSWRNMPALVVVAVAATALMLGCFIRMVTANALSIPSIMLMSVSDALIIFLPFIFLRPSWRALLMLPALAVGFMCLAETVYFRNFSDMIPGASAMLLQSVDRLVVNAAVASMRWADLIYLFPALAVASMIISAGKRGAVKASRRFRIGYVGATALMIVASAWMSHRRICKWYDIDSFGEGVAACADNWHAQTSHKGYLECFGFNALVAHTFGDILKRDHELTDDDRNRIRDFFDRETPQQQISIPASGDKNLILIIVESLSSELFRIPEARSIIPTLMQLSSDSTSLVALDMRVQAGEGRSADAQLIYNTGLLPLDGEPFVGRYASANYPSLAKAMNRADAVEIIGEDIGLWHHGETSKSYGYGRLAADCATAVDADSAIFHVAMKEIRQLRSPFFAEITTLSMHDPYVSAAVTPTVNEERLAAGYPDERDRNYLQAAAHFDRWLGWFISGLKNAGLFDNTLIVIVGDHEPRRGCLSDRFAAPRIPLLILNSGCPAKIKREVDQADLFPTILDLTGVSDYRPEPLKASYRGFGQSLIVTQDPASDIATKREISRLMIAGRYFNNPKP